MRANQLPLYLSSAAYMLLHAFGRLGLKGTDMARAQCRTIGLKLLKIGARSGPAAQSYSRCRPPSTCRTSPVT